MASDHVVDAFLKIEGIPGESLDEMHPREIELMAYEHGITQGPGSDPSTAGSLTAGRCEHSDLRVVKGIDIATPPLYAYCCNGRHIPAVTLTVHRAGGDKVKYFEIKLTDVLVTTVRPWTTSEADLPCEEVTFKYGRIDWTYTKTKLDGSAAGDTMAYWDLKTNSGSK